MRSKRVPSTRADYAIQALIRGMKVLDALLEARMPLDLDDLATRTGLPRSTVFRIVVNLAREKYLVETDEGYWLGLKMLRFGALVEEKLDLKQQARPFLAALRDQVNETVHLGMLDHEMRVVYLEKLSGGHAIGLMASRIGLTAPMHCTALGKTMAAFRPEEEIRDWIHGHGLKVHTEATITCEDTFLQELQAIRARGFGVDNAENEPGVHCVAAPVRDRTGEVVAAISISGPHTRMPDPLSDSSMVRQVVRTAAQVSQALGFVDREDRVSTRMDEQEPRREEQP